MHPEDPPFQPSAIPVARFETRARADEAMLALQSLDIPAWLRHDPDSGLAPWLIEAPDSHSAVTAERQLLDLKEEASDLHANRPVSPPSLGKESGLYWIVGIILSNILVFWATEHYGSSTNHPTLLRFGAITTTLVAKGQVWRLVTAIFLHIGARHLVGNMLLLSAMGTLCLRLWGPGRLLATYLGGGIIGNIAGFIFGSARALKAGASGAILALLGGLAGQRLRELMVPAPHRYKMWHILAALVAFYGMVVGVRPESDHVAHVGGIVGGAFFALILPAPGTLSPKGERALGAILALTAICTAFAAGLGAASWRPTQ